MRLVPDEDVVDFADSGFYTPDQVAVARARVAAGTPGTITVNMPLSYAALPDVFDRLFRVEAERAFLRRRLLWKLVGLYIRRTLDGIDWTPP